MRADFRQYFPGKSIIYSRKFDNFGHVIQILCGRCVLLFKFLGTPFPNFQNRKKFIQMPGLFLQKEHFFVQNETFLWWTIWEKDCGIGGQILAII